MSYALSLTFLLPTAALLVIRAALEQGAGVSKNLAESIFYVRLEASHALEENNLMDNVWTAIEAALCRSF